MNIEIKKEKELLKNVEKICYNINIDQIISGAVQDEKNNSF